MRIKNYQSLLGLSLLVLMPFIFSMDVTLPEVNQKVVEYCNQKMGKKVDRGECWDLARFALDYAGANWEAPYDFGKKVDYKKDALLAGDIIQFEKVEFSDGFSAYQHTAIVYEVIDENKIVIVHQNFNNVRKVSTLELDLSKLTKGKLEFFRPQAGE